MENFAPFEDVPLPPMMEGSGEHAVEWDDGVPEVNEASAIKQPRPTPMDFASHMARVKAIKLAGTLAPQKVLTTKGGEELGGSSGGGSSSGRRSESDNSEDDDAVSVAETAASSSSAAPPPLTPGVDQGAMVEGWQRGSSPRVHELGPAESVTALAATSGGAVDDVDPYGDGGRTKLLLAIQAAEAGAFGAAERGPDGAMPVPSRALARRGSRVRLPALDLQVVQRQYTFLDAVGVATTGVEQMVALTEVPVALKLMPIALRVPRLCSMGDEIPLMPCKRESTRAYQLEVEQWREPIRSRDKNWRLDSQRFILGSRMSVLAGPRDRPRAYPRCRFRQRPDPLTQDRVARDVWSKGTLISKKRLWRLGCMVSDQYCIIHVWGMGIHGRVWGPGLRASRRITLEAYIPACSQTLELEISMERLLELFDDRPPEDRVGPDAAEYVPKMLEAGHKAQLSQLLGRMLYFDYFEDELGHYRKLCISPGIKQTDAELRRIANAERLARLEAERLRRQREWLATPKRRRGLVAQRALRVRGIQLIGSVFEYPDRPGIFVVKCYSVDRSSDYELTLGALQAAQFVGELDHDIENWVWATKHSVAYTLLGKLGLEHLDANNDQKDPESETMIQLGYRTGLGAERLTTKGIRYAHRVCGQPHMWGGTWAGAAYRPQGSHHTHWPLLRDGTHEEQRRVAARYKEYQQRIEANDEPERKQKDGGEGEDGEAEHEHLHKHKHKEKKDKKGKRGGKKDAATKNSESKHAATSVAAEGGAAAEDDAAAAPAADTPRTALQKATADEAVANQALLRPRGWWPPMHTAAAATSSQACSAEARERVVLDAARPWNPSTWQLSCEVDASGRPRLAHTRWAKLKAARGLYKGELVAAGGVKAGSKYGVFECYRNHGRYDIEFTERLTSRTFTLHLTAVDLEMLGKGLAWCDSDWEASQHWGIQRWMKVKVPHPDDSDVDEDDARIARLPQLQAAEALLEEEHATNSGAWQYIVDEKEREELKEKQEAAYAKAKRKIDNERELLQSEEAHALASSAKAWAGLVAGILRKRARWVLPAATNNLDAGEYYSRYDRSTLVLDRTIYSCLHKVESMSADERWQGEQYLLMRVKVEGTALAIEAYHPESQTELPVVATLTSRHEMMRTYRELNEQERYINLQVQFAGFAIMDSEGSDAIYPTVRMLG